MLAAIHSMPPVAREASVIPLRGVQSPQHRERPYSAFDVEQRFAPVDLRADSSALDGLVHARRRVKRGESAYRAGDSFMAVFAIRAGFFKTRGWLDSAREQVVGFHMPGDLLGLDGIAGDRHTVDAIALEDSEVGLIAYGRIEPRECQQSLRRAMARELMRGQGVMMLLGTMRAEQRLAAFLLDLSQRLLARGYSAREFHLRMTRDEIGSHLGLSLETVSRLFSRFQAQRLIDVCNKHVKIVDLDALRDVLRHEAL